MINVRGNTKHRIKNILIVCGLCACSSSNSEDRIKLAEKKAEQYLTTMNLNYEKILCSSRDALTEANWVCDIKLVDTSTILTLDCNLHSIHINKPCIKVHTVK